MSTAPLSRARPAPRERTHAFDQPSLRTGLAGLVLFVLTGALSAVDPADAVGVLLLVGTAALMGAGLTPTGAAGIGIAAWAFCEGFVLHSEGQLRLAPSDLWLLVVSVLVCVAPAALATRGGGRRG